MRYRKLSLLLVFSLIFLLLISLALICTWFYYYFYDDKEKTSTGQYESYDPQTASHTRDSLKRVYTATINDLNHPGDSLWNNPDSIKASLDSKFIEYNRLRNEISVLLDKNSNTIELDTARIKISILQQRIEELRNRTRAVENENKRLSEIVKQLNSRIHEEKKEKTDPGTFNPSMKTGSSAAKTQASFFTTSELRLSAEKVNAKGTEAGGGRLTGSFTVRNSQSFDGSEIHVVVLQPNGRTLLNSDWETGSFPTDNGSRIYSVRIPFDYTKGENRRLSFSINTEELEKGTYTMEVYHAGKLIGKSNTVID